MNSLSAPCPKPLPQPHAVSPSHSINYYSPASGPGMDTTRLWHTQVLRVSQEDPGPGTHAKISLGPSLALVY